MDMARKLGRWAAMALIAAGLGACSNFRLPTLEGVDVRPPGEPVASRDRDSPGSGRLFGDGGLVNIGLFGAGRREEGSVIGVNSFLWRASLDTVAFMPLQSADPFGGVILTDWYSPPEAPDERFKVTVYILGRDLRADGVRVQAFRQVRGGTDAARFAQQQVAAVPAEAANRGRGRARTPATSAVPRGTDGWLDAQVGNDVATEIENAILTRARQLRIGGVRQ